MLDGRRMLVLLDNARDADQVRPLLPGSPTCLVVVTSRSRLTGLVAAGAARPLTLNLLPADEARDLLAHRLGSARMAADPDAADAIIARCAGLPLALAIIAALAATSSLPLATIAAELDDECSTLDTLDAGDPLSDARAVFSWSYRTLSPDGAQLFRLLGLHPGPDISTAAGASLVGRPLRETRRLFVELCTASLLTEHVPGRYVLHDLLRAYAIELAHTHDDHATRQHSIHRLLDHYLHTAHGAALLVTPHRTMAVEPAQPGVAPESLADHEHALAWFTAEHRVLLTAIGHAAAHGFDRHVWQLAWILWDVLSQRGYWHEWYETQHAGLAATQRLADSDAEALAHRGVAQACAHLGRYAEAGPHLRQALALYRQMGDRHGLADAELSLCALLSRQNRHTEALHHCEQARDMFAAVGDQRGEALALSTIGFLHSELSHGAEAIEYGQRAVTLIRQLHDHSSEASVLTNLGYAHHRIGQHRQAVRYYERAARMFEALGSHFLRAEALLDLGDTHLAAGEPDAARTAWRKALELFDASGNPQADKARTRLATIAPV
jgi:Flp pilus assembly protein TadD